MAPSLCHTSVIAAYQIKNFAESSSVTKLHNNPACCPRDTLESPNGTLQTIKASARSTSLLSTCHHKATISIQRVDSP
jgi:hypothetical protein